MLKIYQPQTTIDLLEVRSYVMERFETAFDITNSHKEAYDLALKASVRKYKDKI